MTVDLEVRLRTTFETVLPLLFEEEPEAAAAAPIHVDAPIVNPARPPRSRRILIAACAAILIATVAVIAVTRGRDEPVVPADTVPPSVTTNVSTTLAALPDPPEWYGWIKPYLPEGFHHVAVGTLGPRTLYYTAINLDTQQSLNIRFLGDPTSVPDTAPAGELQQTNDGYYVNTPAGIHVGVECGFGNVLVSYDEGGAFCDSGVADLVRRDMTIALAETFPFEVLGSTAVSERSPVGMDAVASLMAVGNFADLPMMSGGQGAFEEYAWFGPPSGNSGVVVGATVTVISNVYPADDSGDEPVMHAHGDLAVGWSIRDGIAVRVFTSHVTNSLDEQSSLLGQLAPLVRYTATIDTTTIEPATIDDTTTPTVAPPVSTAGTTVSTADLRSGEQTYRVRAGDVLVVIATKFCITAESLIAANGWEGFDHPLFPGDVVTIPPEGCAGVSSDNSAPPVVGTDPTYKVQVGDTLGTIARKTGRMVEDIIAVNAWPAGEGHIIVPGDIIRLPAQLDSGGLSATGASSTLAPPG